MFKGLRTKIESELVQGIVQPQSPKNSSNVKPQQSTNNEQNETKYSDIETTPDISVKPSNQLEDAAVDEEGPIKQKWAETDSTERVETPDKLENLIEELNSLKAEIESLKKERDETKDQNTLLCTLVEKLRRNIEAETESKSSLEMKVSELEERLARADEEAISASNNLLKLESQLKENTLRLTDNTINPANGSVPNKSATDNSSSSISGQPEEISNQSDILRDKVEQLTKQLSEKNKIIRLKQQNLNDLKKALQKEMLEHSKTQRQLSLASGNNRSMIYESAQLSSAINNHSTNNTNHCYNHTNNNNLSTEPSFSAPCSTEMSGNSPNHYFSNNAPLSRHQTTLSLTSHDGSESPSGGTMTPQLDRLSCRSRSSVCVSDFDPNDMTNKEVNQEYLRNILYRYMTSTDSEKAQHLIKVISVLMNFSPEQCSAIKSAMISRFSWLKLR